MDIKLDELTTKLQALKDAIRQNYKAEVIDILDYYIHEHMHDEGKLTEEVIVNILVRFKEDTTLFDLTDLADFLEKNLHVKVNVIAEDSLHTKKENAIIISP